MKKALIEGESNKKNKIIIGIIFISILYLIPILIKNQYTIHLLVISCIYIILACSLNLITGYMGAFSVGHAAFYGIGAYTSALLAIRLGWSFWVTIWFAMLLAAFFGILLGIPSLRLKSSYFVVTSIAFGSIVYLLMVNLVGLTRGPLGLVGIPAPTPIKIGITIMKFNTKVEYYYLLLTFVLIILFLLGRLLNSRTGRAIISLREDSVAAEVIGIDVRFYKIFTFVIGSMMAGLAGALYAHYVRFISPESFNITASITILIMMIVGGIGTFYGPVIGALGITFLLEKLRFLSGYRLMIYGFMLFLVIFFMNKGIMGFIQQILKQRRKT